jgi:hypothetical protein
MVRLLLKPWGDALIERQSSSARKNQRAERRVDECTPESRRWDAKKSQSNAFNAPSSCSLKEKAKQALLSRRLWNDPCRCPGTSPQECHRVVPQAVDAFARGCALRASMDRVKATLRWSSSVRAMAYRSRGRPSITF